MKPVQFRDPSGNFGLASDGYTHLYDKFGNKFAKKPACGADVTRDASATEQEKRGGIACPDCLAYHAPRFTGLTREQNVGVILRVAAEKLAGIGLENRRPPGSRLPELEAAFENLLGPSEDAE